MNIRAKRLVLSCFTISLLLLLSFKQYNVNTMLNRNTQHQQHQEKFMTYLPHSGLHNQRISLINAMIISKILNRTLLMPEMNIGVSVNWKPSTILSHQLEYCPSVATGKVENIKELSTRLQCHHYNNYAPVTVESLFNLTKAHERFGIRTKQRTSMRRDYYLSMTAKDTTVYRLNDTTRYTYQFYEKTINIRDEKYENFIDLESLKDRPELYIEFGSLFGGSRLALVDENLIQMREHLHCETGLNMNSIINYVSQEIIHLLGNNFTSLHLRQGDGTFKKTAAETIESISLALQQKLELQQQRNNHVMIKEDEHLVTQNLLFHRRTTTVFNRLKTCLSIQNLNIIDLQIIYLATDAKKPRKRFIQLYDRYPCLFTLNDFNNVIQEAKRKESNFTVDLLLPMIDAEIASQSKLFIGTPNSTFSAYVQHRNQHYN